MKNWRRWHSAIATALTALIAGVGTAQPAREARNPREAEQAQQLPAGPTAVAAMNQEILPNLVVQDINGEQVELAQYRGQVLLIVNTASFCGFTGQYNGLQALYDRYREAGLVVLGFPSDNFMNQEFGTDEEIAEFCELNFGVTFPLFSKIDVRGRSIHPLFAWLTSAPGAREHAGAVGWNFNKFLIDRHGRLVGRFGSRVEPEDRRVTTAVEAALAQRL